jgi:DnaK suppressor protein
MSKRPAPPIVMPAPLLGAFREQLARREQTLRREVEVQTDRDLEELLRIAQARRRIDTGAYGLCQDCGGAIDLMRLAAEPAGTRCLVCQAAAEHWSRDAF